MLLCGNGEELPINVGDVVRLKSGGLSMTVGRVWDASADVHVVTCVWLDTYGAEHALTLSVDVLEVVKRDE